MVRSVEAVETQVDHSLGWGGAQPSPPPVKRAESQDEVPAACHGVQGNPRRILPREVAYYPEGSSKALGVGKKSGLVGEEKVGRSRIVCRMLEDYPPECADDAYMICDLSRGIHMEPYADRYGVL